MLNNNDPSMEPLGTPNLSSLHVIYEPLILVLCFFFFKKIYKLQSAYIETIGPNFAIS